MRRRRLEALRTWYSGESNTILAAIAVLWGLLAYSGAQALA